LQTFRIICSVGHSRPVSLMFQRFESCKLFKGVFRWILRILLGSIDNVRSCLSFCVFGRLLGFLLDHCLSTVFFFRYFSNNQITGPIPAGYAEPPLLRDLFLNGNRLTGTVPDIEDGQLGQLTEFLLQNNVITGTMSDSICQLRTSGSGLLDDLWADCSTNAASRIECALPDCCTLCFPP
jgi:hypothetical protein